ncbi:MAG TPA: SulP family inorganic anion transporter [Coleofasciculaceae cyanobacterium]|jgi:SulP family sulfate permease
MFFIKAKPQRLKSRKYQNLNLKNIRGLVPTFQADVLAGITVALALIPESLAFAAIVKVNPMVALYTSFCMATVISLAGGRPAMISAATGSMALLMTSLVAKHGLEYLFAATVLTGIIQFLMGIFKLGRFFTFIPPSVIAGFVNALGILIFTAQLQQFAGEPWQMYVMVAATLAIVYLFPRITKAVPSPLVAIVVMTIAAISMNLPIRRVGDIGAITATLPSFHIPHISLSLETLSIILPYSLPLAIVGILESLLTAALVDELTETKSSRNKEVQGQGIANIVTGFFGGMAGCGMVGQSIINVRSGGRSRLSTFVSGAFLLFSIMLLRDVVMQIPMAALIGVMIMVAAETFDWKSLKQLQKMPLSEAFVMPLTVIIVVWTHDLAKGVIAGVLVSAVVFAWKLTHLKTTISIDSDGSKLYQISGQIFFGSMTHFLEIFNYSQDPEHIVIDFSHAHIWDHSAVTAVSKVVQKYRKLNKEVTLVGLNEESKSFVRKIGIPELSVQ